jgi:hypothetical protein
VKINVNLIFFNKIFWNIIQAAERKSKRSRNYFPLFTIPHILGFFEILLNNNNKKSFKGVWSLNNRKFIRLKSNFIVNCNLASILDNI